MPPRSKQPPVEVADQPRRARTRAARAAARVPVDVTAVLVAHDGAAWLPEAMRALAASTRVPARVACVDTGSVDGSAELMEGAFDNVLRLPRATGFGAAVAAALADTPPTEWVWLLHDDLAVEPTTLEALLDHAATSPSVALLGPKVRDWHDPRLLVEVGVTTDAAGHRETGLERREHDQGQHDAIRDVLAVGTAGALVRRSVWDAVGGLDPHLPLFRDDLDLGWKVNAAGHRVVVVPPATVRHVRAATTGRRSTDAAPGRASGIDRRNALYVLLAHAGPLRLLGLLPRLLLASLFQVLALLLTRQPAEAGDEVRALLHVLGRPRVLQQARAARSRQRTVAQRRLRPLFASRWLRIRTRAAALTDWLSSGGSVGSTVGALGDPGPEGPDEFADLADGSGWLRNLLLRPGVLLFLVLSGIALLAERSLLAFHGATLYGGALLPAPDSASDLWDAYTASWHDVSVGTSAPAPPATAVLALVSTVLLDKPWLAVDTLLLASVPLAAVSAYLAAGRLVRHRVLRLWAAGTWALLPVATGAVAAGHLDAAVAQVALPLLAAATGRVLTSDPGPRGWWRVWALGLGLAVTAAFSPVVWPIAALVLLGGAVVNLLLKGSRARALAATVVAVTPLLVLFPWSLSALVEPSVFLATQHPAELDLPATHLLALHPGGPGMPATLVAGGVVLAGLGGLVRRAGRALALASWAVALVGLAVAAALSRVEVEGNPVWPGAGVQVAGLAVLTAALVAGNGVRQALREFSFGWRQPLAGAVVVLAALAPVACALGWVVRGADDPLRRDGRQVLPAFARAELEASPGLRVLQLKPLADGRVAYELGPGRLGLEDSGVRPSSSQRHALDRIVADLVSPRGSDAAEALSTRAVRYVALIPGPGADAVRVALDAQVGLVRRTTGAVPLWRVAGATARLQVVGPELATAARRGNRAPDRDQVRATPPLVLVAGREEASVQVPRGAEGRLLVLADAHERGWEARVDGEVLDPTRAWGWAQAFELPSEGGRLEVTKSHAGRRTSLVVQGGLLLAVLVLAAPAGRRRRGLEDESEVDDATPGGAL